MKLATIPLSAVLLSIGRATAFVVPQSITVDTCSKSCVDHDSALRSAATPVEIAEKGILLDHLSTLTVLQLKDLLRHQGLKVGGNKADLVERLLGSNGDGDDSVIIAVHQKNEKQTKEEKIAAMADIVKKKRAALAVDEAIPSPGLKRQVAMAVETAVVKANEGKKVDKDSVGSNGGFSSIQDLPASIISRLDTMGIKEPTPIQRDAIPLALQGKDIMGVAQTGTGKTLAFGLPLVSQMMNGIPDTTQHKHSRRPIRGLILAPTRELANQIAVELGTLMHGSQLNTYVVVGGQNINTQVNKLKAQRTDLLVATPGRLIDLMDRGALTLRETSFLVLDEADLMLDMGFHRDLNKIAKMLPSERQTLLFSATMSAEINEVANNYLRNPQRVSVARAGKTADKIAQEVHFIERSKRTDMLLSMLSNEDNRDDRSIVFGRTKHGMERLSKTMIANGIKAASIHGNKSQPARDRALAAFKSGEIKVLVATDVAARGLDIPDVKRVYNFELPNQSEAYVHRIGRTARAGKEGMAISFCAPEDMDYLYYIQKLIGMEIPVSSGKPYTKRETQEELDRAKANKAIQERRQRENRNNPRASGGRGGGRGRGRGRGGNKNKRRKH
mmetsp:Transcript_34914/g.73628  ORF Transcript_34914/g.73628 Transcript_34914/m.73628 type:complete len:615 (+) Transcript_34914:123-1967(+)